MVGAALFVLFIKSGDCVEGLRGGQASLASVLSALFIIAEILSFNLQL